MGNAEVAMPSAVHQFPLRAMTAGFRKFSVDEYEQLVALGIITEDDNLELLEGYLVNKMGHNPPHDGTIQIVEGAIGDVLPAGWCTRIQSVVRLSTSEPEPDIVVVRGGRRSYLQRHPMPAEIGLVIEVSDSTLDSDRADKIRVYARDGIAEYWIINIPERQIEVYTDPQPAASPPAYAVRTDYRPGQAVPLVLDGTAVGTVPVADLLP